MIYTRGSNSISGNNVANNSWYGIYIDCTPGNVLRNNTISDNEYNFGVSTRCPWAFYQDIDTTNTVDGKSIYYWVAHRDEQIPSDAGYVALINSINITVKGLSLSRNGHGILLVNTTNSEVTDSNLVNNSYGVNMGDSCTNNEFYHNNFIDNDNQAYSGGLTNVWDHSYPSGGNCWSDYTDVDLYSGPYQNETGSDGIWDHPYIIDENNQDRYPLVSPWTPTPLAPDFSTTAFPTSLTIQQGSSDTSTITITSIGDFNQPVQLTISGAPSGVTATLNPEQVTPPSDGSTTSTLTISVEATATLGSYTLTVTGTNGTLTHSVDISLDVTIPENQPPDPPTFLFQYELDGPEIPVGGTISGDAVTLIGVMSDPDGDQVKLQIELRRVDEYDGNFIGVPTHESEFVESDYGVMINITSLILGYYHWQARTVDEVGATSDWVSFPEPLYPPNPESAADFTIELKFRPPYAIGDNATHKEAYGSARARSSSFVDSTTGEGGIEAGAVVFPFFGVAHSWSSFTFSDGWMSSFSGKYRIVASFNIVRGDVALAIFEFKIGGGAISGATLTAWLTVRDVTEHKDVLKVPRVICDLETHDVFSPKNNHYDDSSFFIEGLVDLEQGHLYSWFFEMKVTTTMSAWEAAGGVAKAVIHKAKLIEVHLEPPEVWVPPEEEPPTVEKAVLVAVGSPVEVLVVDPDGRRVGFDFISKQEVNEIPDAWYSGPDVELQFIYIPGPLIGNYEISLAGTDRGTYALIATSMEPGEATSFTAIEIPVATNEIHQYTIDWDTLSLGEEGVTVQVDSDGDGVFEHTFTSDNELTQSEFLTETGQRALFFEIVWGAETFTVSVESNSTVYNFAFNQPDKEISFNVTGSADTVGFCNVTIPKVLLYGEPWTVLIDGAPVPATITENATHSFLYFTYAHSTHKIQIIGTWVIGDTNPPLIDTPFQEPEPDKVTPTKAVTVSVNVTDTESGVKSVILSYTANGGVTWTNLTMLYNATTALYQATIPAFPSGTTVCYKIIAYDNAGNLAINDNAGQYYCYTVSAPVPPLSVSISPLSASILAGQSVTFTSTVTGGVTPYTYQWYLNGNPVSGATSDIWTFTPTTSGIYYVYLKVTDDTGNTTQSETARTTVTTVPVGGYSVPIQLPTTTQPATLHIALLTILTAIFITIKRKTKRKH